SRPGARGGGRRRPGPPPALPGAPGGGPVPRGVPGRLPAEPAPNRRHRLDTRAAGQDPGRCLGIEPVEVWRGQVGSLERVRLALARSEDDHDPLRVESARDEAGSVGGARVEPVRVVDETADRPALGQLREQRQTAGEDEEALLAGAFGKPECTPQGSSGVAMRNRARYATATAGLSRGSRASWVREVMPSLAKTLRRWWSIVRGD